MRVAFQGRRRLLLAALILVFPLIVSAQPAETASTDTAKRLDALAARLEALDREAAAIRAEIEAIRTETGTTTQPEITDLTAVETITPTTPQQPVATTDVQVISNPPSAGTSKVFNPDISIIGNVVGHAGGDNPDERDSIALQEAELALEAAIDPYAKARFFIGYSDEEVAVEEGYAQFISLPWDLTAKVGKMKASAGKFNQTHFHTWPTIDAPLMNATFFGEEGIADSGVSVTKLIPAGSVLLEATGEVFRGDVEDVFATEGGSNLLWVGRLRGYGDITENSNIDVGASFVHGSLPEGGGSNEFAGVDVTYRWKPLSRSIYRSLIARGEVFVSDRDDMDETALGAYAGADWQFARRWLTGFRWDYVERPDDRSVTDRGASLTLTFRPSEFSLIRGQFRQMDYGDGEETNEVLLQLQFGIGAHGAHPF